jgi:UDP-N-acetylmuramyl pentapeptide phosphotransferase/UDP-N-acetylglucosamine-1-phosphate transferase
MLNVVLTAAVAFVITFLSIPVIISIANQKKLFDLPDARKIHCKPIASLGGIGIFGGFFLATLLGISTHLNPEFQYFFAAATVIFFLGVKDDLMALSATKKFIGQIIAAAILIHLGGLKIESMHGLFGFNELPESFSIALSYMTIILVINAYNLIDGVDGLAGTLGMFSASVFGAYFFIAGMEAYALLAFSLAGSLGAFLIFNYHPAKIFMGDSGSLLIGLVNSILAIKFITVADSSAVAIPLESAVAIGISILLLPLLDTIRVFGLRILKGKSPFSPDRTHIHHLLLERGLNHRHITLLCLLLNMSFIGFAYTGRGLGPTSVLFALTALSIALVGTLVYFIKPVTKPAEIFITNSALFEEEVPAVHLSKVIPINKEIAVGEN